MDYTEHPDAKHLKLEKQMNIFRNGIGKWKQKKISFRYWSRRGKRLSVLKETGRGKQEEQESEPLTLQGESPKKSVRKNEKQTTVYKVEDLFQKSTDGGGD